MKHDKFDDISLCRICNHRFRAAFREKCGEDIEDTNFVIICLAADIEIGGMDCIDCNHYEPMEE